MDLSARCVVRVQCLVVSQHVEVWACDGVELVLEAPVATVQVVVQSLEYRV